MHLDCLSIINGLCLFIALLSFKPSEPYLSEFLICQQDTQSVFCSSQTSNSSCFSEAQCYWTAENICSLNDCSNIPASDCEAGSDDDAFNYCSVDSSGKCSVSSCYKDFTADQVNNEIYPWSTYAYLPFLLSLGPLAELVSFRGAILIGLCGRVITRFLLLYGNSVSDMQIMQVTYAMGTAAEDVFSGYVYHVVPLHQYQAVTSYIKASAMISHVAAVIFSFHLAI